MVDTWIWRSFDRDDRRERAHPCAAMSRGYFAVERFVRRPRSRLPSPGSDEDRKTSRHCFQVVTVGGAQLRAAPRCGVSSARGREASQAHQGMADFDRRRAWRSRCWSPRTSVTDEERRRLQLVSAAVRSYPTAMTTSYATRNYLVISLTRHPPGVRHSLSKTSQTTRSVRGSEFALKVLRMEIAHEYRIGCAALLLLPRACGSSSFCQSSPTPTPTPTVNVGASIVANRRC